MVYTAKFLEAEQTIWRCLDCGMVYACSPEVDYAAESPYADPQTYGCDTDEVEHYRQIAERLAKRVPLDSQVLEIGCATGGVLKALREVGFRNLKGFDLSERASEHCRKLGFEVSSDEIPDGNDLVILSHVLEHVIDPETLLRKAKKALTVEGSVYIEVPDATRYGNLSSMTEGFNLEHINHFTIYHLRLLMNRVRLQPFSWDEGSFRYWGDDYPIVWQLASRKSLPENHVRGYISTLKSQTETILAGLKDVPKRIAVWGLGQTAKRIFSEISRTVVAATDSNSIFHGKKMLGVSVVPPEQFRPDPNVPILICSQLRKAEIFSRITELGLTNECIPLDSKVMA